MFDASDRASNSVDLDPAVQDAWGFPAGRVTYSPHRAASLLVGHHT